MTESLAALSMDAVSESRREASEIMKRVALPHLKMSGYQFFPVRHFENRRPDRLDSIPLTSWKEKEIRFGEGSFMAPLEDLRASGVELYSLEESFWERKSENREDFFSAWIRSSWRNGLILRVKEGARVEDSIRFQYSPNLKDSDVFRRIIYLEKNARLSWIEDVEFNSAEENVWLGQGLQIVLEEGAELDFQRVTRGRFEGTEVSREEAFIGKDAKLNYSVIPSASRRTQIFSDFRLQAPESQLDARMSPLGDGQDLLQWSPLSFHESGESKAETSFFGLAKEKSRLIFDAMIEIPLGKSRSESHQLSKSLVLSERASVVNLPKLKIATDDVVVSHGASVSSFEEDQLYYLQSRGLSELKARQLIVTAFVEPLIDRLRDESLQKEVRKLVRLWMEKGGLDA